MTRGGEETARAAAEGLSRIDALRRTELPPAWLLPSGHVAADYSNHADTSRNRRVLRAVSRDSAETWAIDFVPEGSEPLEAVPRPAVRRSGGGAVVADLGRPASDGGVRTVLDAGQGLRSAVDLVEKRRTQFGEALAALELLAAEVEQSGSDETAAKWHRKRTEWTRDYADARERQRAAAAAEQQRRDAERADCCAETRERRGGDVIDGPREAAAPGTAHLEELQRVREQLRGESETADTSAAPGGADQHAVDAAAVRAAALAEHASPGATPELLRTAAAHMQQHAAEPGESGAPEWSQAAAELFAEANRLEGVVEREVILAEGRADALRARDRVLADMTPGVYAVRNATDRLAPTAANWAVVTSDGRLLMMAGTQAIDYAAVHPVSHLQYSVVAALSAGGELLLDESWDVPGREHSDGPRGSSADSSSSSAPAVAEQP